jgi:hypothetical protein
MQLVVTAEADTAQALDGFSDLIGKRALRRRRKSLEKKAEEEVDDKATGVGSGRDAANTVEETGETAQEGDTPAAPPRIMVCHSFLQSSARHCIRSGRSLIGIFINVSCNL